MQQVLLRENKIRRHQEHFWVVGLDNENKTLFVELVSLGAANSVSVAPPEVFRMGIYKLAVRMILVHNHPSGNLSPSDSDLDFTDKMLKAGRMINIEVIDHLIISDAGFLSFEDSGQMDQLRHSGNYELVDKKEGDRLQKFKLDMEREKGEYDKAINIAKKMKAKGYDEKDIKELTGLKLGEIRGL